MNTLVDVLRIAVANKEAIGFVIGGGGLLAKLIPFLGNRYRRYTDLRNLTTRIGAEFYTREDLVRATEFYIEPESQSIDPSGSEDFRRVFAARQSAFASLDKLLSAGSEHKYTILLGDSGMGKTSLLLNYYARNCRRKKNKIQIALVPLGSRNAETAIESIQNRSDTVLFLDAFDEDTQAIRNHRQRLQHLLKITEGFKHVLITCRTQFFEKDNEIPKETGLFRFGVTAAGQSREYFFHKIYLSPFSNEQIERYLRRRFPIWELRRRRIARDIAEKMPDLTVRPMLLAHVHDLLQMRVRYRYSIHVYEAMITAWLLRERPFVDADKLRSFSEALALEIYCGRQRRGSERIPPSEALHVAVSLAIPLESWQLRTRSLLNRDADGNLKFAHRSLMEYLFVHAYVRNPKSVQKTTWTDQMKKFWWELMLVANRQVRGKMYDIGLTGFPHLDQLNHCPGLQVNRPDIWDILQTADLDGLEQLRLQPLLTLRSSPITLSNQQLRDYLQANYCMNQTFSVWRKHYPSFMKRTVCYDTESSIPKEVVVDHLTGLMWSVESTWADTRDQALVETQALCRDGWGGYSDWRLPTAEELLSLLPMSVSLNAHGFEAYPHNLFEPWRNELWASDTLNSSPAAIRYDAAEIVTDESKGAFFRIVRSIERSNEA